MSLDAIKKSILSEAESKASAIESEASKESNRILKEAEEKARQIVKNAEQDAEKEVARLKKESEAGAETEANSMILAAKGEVVERVLKRVSSQTGAELSKNNLDRILSQGMKQFKEIAAGSTVTIKTSKRNAAMLKDSKYNVEAADLNGFMFYADNGRVALNATIDNLVEGSKDAARKLIAQELFREGARSKRTSPKPKVKSVKKAKGKKKR